MMDAQHDLDLTRSMILAAGIYATTSSMDLGAAATPVLAANPLLHDPGAGKPKYMVFLITTTFLAAAGAATVQFQVQTGTGVAAGGDINAGQKPLIETEAVAKATVVAGYRRILPIPHDNSGNRFLGGVFIIATNPGTAGALSVWVTDLVQTAPVHLQ